MWLVIRQARSQDPRLPRWRGAWPFVALMLGCLWPAAALLVAQETDASSGRRQGMEFFEKHIRPVLVEHCYECHSGKSEEIGGDLRLDSAEAIRRGGSSGPALIAGKPDQSLLIDALRYQSFEMPPNGKLPDSVIQRFVQWIEMGAPDPRSHTPADGSHGRREPTTLWSFQAIRRPVVPTQIPAQWNTTAVDAFLAARWQAKQITPAPLADRRTLIRRLYYDLTGLPPSPEEVADFLNDARPDAWPRLVDRLLASPHFGERWGRHWLDVTRYADSSGGGRTLIFHDAWRYRDYIVKAMNADTGWNTLIRQHIAGDLMPADSVSQRADQLTATGFMVLGPINYELQDKELLRMEVIDEQLETIGRAFMGLTLGCARCHDHKFDPVTTKDYYALAGFLWSSKSLVPGNVSGFEMHELPLEPHQQAEWSKYQQRRKELADRIAKTQTALKKYERQLAQVKLPGRGRSIELDDEVAELQGNWQTSQSVKPFIGKGYRFVREGRGQAVWTTELPGEKRYELAIAYTPGTNRASNAKVLVKVDGESREFVIDQRKAPDGDPHYQILAEYSIGKAQTVEVTVVNDEADGVVIIDAIRWTELIPLGDATEEQRRAVARRDRLRRSVEEHQQQLASLQADLKKLDASAPPAPPKVMGIKEQPVASDCPLCIRGDVHRPGPRIPRGFISTITPTPPVTFGMRSSGRLELANWITSPEHPLTARVLVNRIWLHLMGEGLVRTPDNFGGSGEPPTHPQLLDFLASEFTANGWSVKHMVRTIVNSRAYRLSVHADPQVAKRDPENRWWARARRRPLDPESLRDTWLVFSGELDRSMGGPSLRVGIKSEFEVRYDSHRRSIYLPVLRNQRYRLFSLFDGADPNVVTGKRSRTILATQALYLMNNKWLLARAETAAKRLLADNTTTTDRIELAFERLLCRPPTDKERQLASAFLRQGERAGADDRLERWTQFCHSLMASLDCRYLE